MNWRKKFEETIEHMKRKYTELLSKYVILNFEDEIFLKRVEYNALPGKHFKGT